MTVMLESIKRLQELVDPHEQKSFLATELAAIEIINLRAENAVLRAALKGIKAEIEDSVIPLLRVVCSTVDTALDPSCNEPSIASNGGSE